MRSRFISTSSRHLQRLIRHTASSPFLYATRTIPVAHPTGRKYKSISWVSTRSITTDWNNNNNDNSNNSNKPTIFPTNDENRGEYYYEKAMEAIRKSEEEKRQQEERLAAEQFEAMKKYEETKKTDDPVQQQSSRKAGVAVIRTISRQTREQRTTVPKIDQWSASTTDVSNIKQTSTDWESEANKLLYEAALRYGHSKALILLGNQAVEEGKSMRWRNDKNTTNEQQTALEQSLSALNPIQRAAHLYQLAGEQGSAEGWFNLGHLLWTGFPSQDDDDETVLQNDDILLKSNRNASMEAFEKAIQLDDPDAMYFVGVQLLSLDDNDSTQSIDTTRGYELINTSADLGHNGAIYYLALLHYNGNDDLQISPCSPSQFRTKLDLAADAEHPDALFLRAHCYLKGDDGYPQNYDMALDDFIRSADAGNADGAISAGAMLHNGGMVRRDQRKAFELYQKAAEMGSMDGWRNLVACYALGEGVPRCEGTARYIARMMLKDEEEGEKEEMR